MSKTISKTAALIAERKSRRDAKQEKLLSDAERLIAAREVASKLSKAMPAAYSDWGVVRTRAYIQLLEIIQSKANNVTMKPDVLEGYLSAIAKASSWSLDYCQHLALLHARAVDISEPLEDE